MEVLDVKTAERLNNYPLFIEIGFKLSTRQLIFILNPCHMLTLIQLILLISPPRRWMHILFRIQT